MNAARFLSAAALVAALAGMASAQIKYVAVVETEVDAQSKAAAKLNKAEVREITAVLRNEARNILPPNKYKIMTAETVIAQGSAKLEECAEENCVIALGSRIGADFIIRGTISTFGAKLTLSIVIYETEDGTLVGSARVSSEKADDLLEKAVAACGEMYRKFENPQSATQKAPPQQQTPPHQPPVTYNAPSIAPPPPPSPQPKTAPTYQTPAIASPTPPPPPPPTYQQSGGVGTFTDKRDGKTYRTVVIGGKRWMAENLNYAWMAENLYYDNDKRKSWCYDNNNSNCDKYGRLYDWKTARTVCPGGWHLPSRQEWNDLVLAAGGNKAGKNLKAESGWSGNGNGTDAYGFSALPGGGYYFGSSFNYAGYSGTWWTSTEFSNGDAYYRGGNAYYRSMYGNIDNVLEGNGGQSGGFPVRCVSD